MKCPICGIETPLGREHHCTVSAIKRAEREYRREEQAVEDNSEDRDEVDRLVDGLESMEW